ncbi:MAG: hypothetical protein R2792_02565 [Saprospiraceae bacterium]
MNKTAIIFCLLFSIHAQGQPSEFASYKRYINEAEYWAYVGKPDTAAQLYAHAFAHFSFRQTPIDLYNAARASALSNKSKECAFYLNKALQQNQSWVKFGIQKKDSLLFRNCLGAAFDTLENRASILAEAIDSSKQILHKKVVFYQGEDNRLTNAKDWNKRSELHQTLLADVEANGYPGIYNSGTDILSIVFLHIDEVNMDCAIELMYKAMLTGEVTPYEYASMMDYFQYRTGNKKAMYGSHQCIKMEEQDYSYYIEERLKTGVSIFFQKPTRTPWKPKVPTEWFENTNILSPYFILDTVIE